MYINTYIYIYTYIHICVCKYVYIDQVKHPPWGPCRSKKNRRRGCVPLRFTCTKSKELEELPLCAVISSWRVESTERGLDEFVEQRGVAGIMYQNRYLYIYIYICVIYVGESNSQGNLIFRESSSQCQGIGIRLGIR